MKIHQSRQGAALVIILALLVLLVGLSVAFLKRTSTEATSASGFAAASASEQLADMAVNLVQGQIHEATTLDPTVAWVSQPGMIRTFGTSSGGGFAASDDLLRTYKLYSAAELISTSHSRGADAPPADWAANPAGWTDLNASVTREIPTGAATQTTDFYPILDPSARDTVEGFSVTAAPINGTSNPIPMPVQWLYVREDGGIHAAVRRDSEIVEVGGNAQDNPIVGRIAFWTDDETSKININTASEGTFWDTPRVDSPAERLIASNQPAQREWQAYSGHPATVSLAPVFFATSETTTPELTATQREAIYEMTPRVVGGGSQGGTRPAPGPLSADDDRLYANVDELIFAAPGSGAPGSERPPQTAAAGITRENIEKARFFLTASSRAPEVTLFNTPRVAIWPTSLRETNAAGQRMRTAFDDLIRFVSTVGGPPGDPYLYLFQRDNAESPTVDWANILRNRQLLRYLRWMSDQPVPGFGEALVSNSTPGDRDQLLVQMLDYIRTVNMFDSNLQPTRFASRPEREERPQFVPGYGLGSATAANSYRGYGQVVPLRVPINLGDSYPATFPDTSHSGFGRFPTISEVGLLFICGGDGSGIDPTSAAAPSGNPAEDANAAKWLSNDLQNRMLGGTLLQADEKIVQMAVLIDWFVPGQGYPILKPDFFIETEQVGGSFSIDGDDAGIPANTTIDLSQHGFDVTNAHSTGGLVDYRAFLRERFIPARGAMPADSAPDANFTPYELVGRPVRIRPSAAGTMAFSGPNRFIIRIYAGSSTSPIPKESRLIQTIEMNFPSADFPVPELVAQKRDGPNHSDTPNKRPSHYWTFHRAGIGFDSGTGRFESTSNSPFWRSGTLIRPEDTFRTLTPYHGDFRVTAAAPFVPAGVFKPTSFYFRTDRGSIPAGRPAMTANFPQIRSHFSGTPETGHVYWTHYVTPASERLVPGANYTMSDASHTKLPKFPVFMDGNTRRPATIFQTHGDFDSGVATMPDGAYINMADGGHTVGIGVSEPYFANDFQDIPVTETYFSPNRQVPGPGIFGSLPRSARSAILANHSNPTANTSAWSTLLFRNQPSHPGAQNPPDHLWMDFFWMPSVEPYAISEPFSTAGKINLNFDIEPFSYIRRATALVGLMRSERMLVVPTSAADSYKIAGGNDYRQSIAVHETLKEFDVKFAAGDVFRSASQIAEVDLIPTGSTHPLPANFWGTHALTGDNARERPYTNLQNRLTTKSNTFTVHYRVQTLKKVPGTGDGEWDESRDRVLSELRGATTIERYINPNAEGIPDYAAELSTDTATLPTDLSEFYRWRILQARRFSP